MIRTSLAKGDLGCPEVIAAHKSWAWVERAFRSLKTTVLQVRPIFHWNEKRVRAHVFLCMLLYYLEWHLRRRWAPLLFAEEGRPARGGGRVQGADAADAGGKAAGAEFHGFAGEFGSLGGGGTGVRAGAGLHGAESERADAAAGVQVAESGDASGPGAERCAGGAGGHLVTREQFEIRSETPATDGRRKDEVRLTRIK